MRIVLNGVALAAAGGRTVGLNLLRHLPRVRPQHEFFAFVPAGVGYEEVCYQNGVAYRSIRRNRFYGAWRLAFDQYYLPRFAREWSADVLFSLSNLGPIRPRVPHVILFHQAYFVYDYDDVHGWSLGARASLAFQRYVFARAARNATAITPQTQVIADRLVSRLGLPAERLRVVPNAVSIEHLKDGEPSGELAAKLRNGGSRYKLLTLAQYYPHKNIEYVVTTAKELLRGGVDDFVFYLTISADQHERAGKLLRRVDAEGLSQYIENLGPLSLDDLGAVYRSVDALFLPTLLESYSGTYLEAVHYGLPILTSDRDFARAVCRDAALYFEPRDRAAGATAVMTLRGSGELSQTMAEAAGRIRASTQPGWAELAEVYADVLEQAVRSSD